MKKFFSLVLALVMALSLTTVAWGATVSLDSSATAFAIGPNTGNYGVELFDGDVYNGNGDTYEFTALTSGISPAGAWDTPFLLRTGGAVTIKNMTIDCEERGIVCFSADPGVDVTIDNVIILNSARPLNVTSDKSSSLTVTNSQFAGKISTQLGKNAEIGNASFTNCKFIVNNTLPEGNEIKPRGADNTTFTNCAFDAGFVLNVGSVTTGTVTLTNCTYAGEQVTSGNFARLFGLSAADAAKVTSVTNASNVALYTLWGSTVVANKAGTGALYIDMPLPTLQKAVAPTATNLSGSVAHYVVNGDYFVEGTAADCDYYFTVTGKTAPVLYLKQVSTPVYLAVATEFTNFGKACGQVDVTPVAGTKAYTWTTLTGDTVVVGGDLAANYATANAYVLVNGKLASVASNDLYAANVVEHSWTFTRDAAGTPVSAKCEDCGATATVYTLFTAVPAGADYIKEGNLFLVINTVPTAGTKVESAQTFDAGIAMYVGMSVMAAAGSAVVLKKKD